MRIFGIQGIPLYHLLGDPLSAIGQKNFSEEPNPGGLIAFWGEGGFPFSSGTEGAVRGLSVLYPDRLRNRLIVHLVKAGETAFKIRTESWPPSPWKGAKTPRLSVEKLGPDSWFSLTGEAGKVESFYEISGLIGHSSPRVFFDWL